MKYFKDEDIKGAVGDRADSPVLNKEKKQFYCNLRHDCESCPNLDCPRRNLRNDDNMEILSDYGEYKAAGKKNALCIDIGTTTIAAQLFIEGKLVKTISAVNRQRSFGADVISRIEASNSGHRMELCRMIRYQLSKCVSEITEGYRDIKIDEAVIAANTTMVQLLMGYSCRGMSLYPFKPENTDMILISFDELAGGAVKAETTIFPAVSAFVGGDIVSGLYMCDFDLSGEVNLFIDLGTNGEMAIGNRDRILTASAAAGPAFEGGRISCGTGSVSGAVCGVDIKNGIIKTIDNKKPIGICGTGIIEAVSELLECGIIDETGLLKEPYFDTGYEICDGIRLVQSDIREFQTSKAAVGTGIEILKRRLSVDYKDIKRVYLAGGFGSGLDVNKACRAGVLPYELRGKVKPIGNSALGGAVKLAFSEDGKERAENIRRLCEEVQLANDEEFNELYISSMNFSLVN